MDDRERERWELICLGQKEEEKPISRGCVPSSSFLDYLLSKSVDSAYSELAQ
jgi:hypothetical protein